MADYNYFFSQSSVSPGASGVTIANTAPQAGDTIATLLAKLLTAYSAGGGGSSGSGNYVPSPINTFYTNTTPYYAVATGAGSTPTNLYSFSVMNAGSGVASFGGVALPAGMSVSYTAAPGTKFNQVSYNGSGNSLYIAGSIFV